MESATLMLQLPQHMGPPPHSLVLTALGLQNYAFRMAWSCILERLSVLGCHI